MKILNPLLGYGSSVGTIFVLKEDYSHRQFPAPTIFDRPSQFGERLAVCSSCNCCLTLHEFNQKNALSPENGSHHFQGRARRLLECFQFLAPHSINYCLDIHVSSPIIMRKSAVCILPITVQKSPIRLSFFAICA